MNEATARVMIMNVSVEPEAAAKGATSASTRICFSPDRTWASRSCSATWAAAVADAARAAAAQRCTRPAAVAVRRSSAGGGGGGLPAPAAAALQRAAKGRPLHLLLLRRRLARWGNAARWDLTAVACMGPGGRGDGTRSLVMGS